MIRTKGEGAISCALPAAFAVLIALAGPASAVAGSEREAEPSAGARGVAYGFTLEPLSPLTQSHPVIDYLGPYFHFLLTNTAAVVDTFHMEIQNLVVVPINNWFPQVCIGMTCFPDSLDLPLGPGASDTVGVNIVPFSDGVGTADFYVVSRGDPTQEALYGVTLYAGTYAVGAEAMTGGESTLALGQNVPNPARGRTQIRFVLPDEGSISLRVYDAAGRLVRSLAQKVLPPGAHAVTWDGRDEAGRPLAAGVYFYRLETPEGTLSRRLTLVR